MSELKTCFKKVDYDLSGLLHYIDIGDIALPDIQRPFVWSNAKVRDLFDSMYRGFPVGYFLFWENVTGGASKQIGVGSKQHTVARLLIVDGQQRLTSLFAVFRGRKVLDEDYHERSIEVAFRPRDGKFEVADAAIRRDPEWIANISTIWATGKPGYQMVKSFLKQLSAKGPLSEQDEDLIAHNLDRLFDLQKYPFTALEIAAAVDEEQVADIFVRINSEGVRLNQADFILTLMSVFWDEGRMALETFCRHSRQPPFPGAPASPFNHFIQPDPDQLLRVAVAYGFERGRLKSVYQVLRGKDMETGEFSPGRRDAQFAILQAAQAEVLNLTHWHQFLSCLIGAGFRSAEMISSQTALLYAYAFYLVGRKRYGMPEHQLQRLIGRWFFAASLTGRYTNSPETIMDGDLNRLKTVKDAASFEATLEGIMANELTNDFWTVTLPSNLDSSSARNPELFAYTAAQNRLGASVLFSHKRVADLLDPAIKTKKRALERHHLFPRAWLERQGVDDLKRINQVANFALIEWPDNIDISDTPPAEYVPKVRSRFSPEEWVQMHAAHALPEGWHAMSYDAFLVARRKLIAAIIRRGFESLKSGGQVDGRVYEAPPPAAIEETVSWKSAISGQSAEVNLESHGDDGDGATSGDEPARYELRRRYWTAFRDALVARGSRLHASEPAPSPKLRFSPIAANIHAWAWISLRHGSVEVGVSFKAQTRGALFAALRDDAATLEEELGVSIRWEAFAEKSWPYFELSFSSDPSDESRWDEQHAWLQDKLERVYRMLELRAKSRELTSNESGT